MGHHEVLGELFSRVGCIHAKSSPNALRSAQAGQYVGGKARTPVATTVVGQQTLQMPASPAASTCSVQSHRSTSDLIANLSSRHEEAQKFLRSYA